MKGRKMKVKLFKLNSSSFIFHPCAFILAFRPQELANESRSPFMRGSGLAFR